MAAFQITITPPAKKAVKADRPVEYVTPKLILAPFNPTPEVLFGSVTLNAKITKPLIIYNSNPSPITVQLKTIDTEDRITISDSNIRLDPREEKEIYISWSPIQSGYLRKVIRFQDVAKKARSFDVILNGTCVCNKVKDKRNRLKDENYKSKVLLSNARKNSKSISHVGSKPVDLDIRRQTYLIEEKENRLPNDLRSVDDSAFRTSSPKYQNSNVTNYFSDNLRSFDNIEAPTKYCNFESELRFNADVSSLHSSSSTNSCRRSTFTLNSEEVIKNPFSLSSVDELDGSLPEATDFKNSIYDKSFETTPTNKNITFDSKTTPENVCFTPIKSLSCLLTPHGEFAELLETPQESTNLTHHFSSDSFSYSSKRNDLMFISPPTKTKHAKKSPDSVVIRRHVSSAISDRKRHLKTNILPRRKTPPSVLKKSKAISAVEKMKTQDPSALKQVLRSHIDDPFLKKSLYCDENWIDRQEKDIIKWMNSLLTPPVELSEESDWTVDAAAVWLQSRRDGDLRTVPSVDNVAAAVYHSPQRLDTLRKVASALLASEPVQSVFTKLTNAIQKKIISIRDDRDVHLDQGLKNKLMQLLSCYNPLWLQIALEAIYNQKISRQGKADISGLGWFIRKHVLTCSSLNKKNAHPAVLQIKKPNYKDEAKKYTLEKFLCLIYFMDKAKIRKLVRHNPCLFVISSEFKSSQELLLAFCEDLVVGRGDITKHLKAINYVLEYRQTCIDEYDYNITSLHDLKDGVRLTRLFEILFNEPDLCTKLRVPAISLLQKIYNVSVAMKVAESKCTIEGDIVAKEIVSGNREKILSFLWQIINNYLTPLYEKSASKVQRWWRSRLIGLRIKKIVQIERHRSATIIQAAWRGYFVKKKFSAVVGQMKKQMTARTAAAIAIQRKFRNIRETRKAKGELQRTRLACVKLQTWWRRVSQRRRFLRLKCAAINVQRRYKAAKLTIQDRQRFVLIKKYTLFVQRSFRANRTMQIERKRFLQLKQSVIFVQTRFRANRLMNMERSRYLAKRTAIIRIQNEFRAFYEMKGDRERYLKLKNNVQNIQRRYRAKKVAEQQRNRYLALKSACLLVQQRFRANKAMTEQRRQYAEFKSTVLLIQRKFRATLSMRRERREFIILKKSVIAVQRKWRANQLMRRDRQQFQNLKTACVLLQRRFRARQTTKSLRAEFLSVRRAAVTVQRLFRAKLEMKLHRNRFIKLNKYVLFIQRKFRCNRLAKQERESYVEYKQAVILIQRQFRNARRSKVERDRYLRLKSSVIQMQRLYRAKLAMKEERERYLTMRRAAVIVQRRYRANRLMRRERERFIRLHLTIVTIQRIFRSNNRTKIEKQRYGELKKACIFVQQKFRANVAAKKEFQQFLNLKKAVISVQRKFRANQAAKVQRSAFLELKRVTINAQQRYRANISMRTERDAFVQLRRSAIFIQSVFRAKLLARKEREAYLSLKASVIMVQKLFRAGRQMEKDRKRFIEMKKAAVTIQRSYRACKVANIQRQRFLRFKTAAVFIQRRFRSKLMVLNERLQHQKEAQRKIHDAATKIQAVWRGYVVRKNTIQKRKQSPSVPTKKLNPNLDTKVTLGERYKKAIMQLKTSDMYDVLTHALWNLESVTMLSAKLCEGVAAEGIIPIIFGLMARGNRSEPSLEIYRTGCSILINLARHQPTKIILWETLNEVDDIYLILHIMKITHDKSQAPVFRYAATLLWLLCQDVYAAQIVRELYSFQQQIEKMLEKIKRLHLRNPQSKKTSIKALPKIEADWYAEPEQRIFDNNYVAILNVHRVLFNR